MALTKTQINYLSDKLTRVVQDKVQEFKREIGNNQKVHEVVMERIVAGEIKFPSKAELIKILSSKIEKNSYYAPSFYLSEIINEADYRKVEQEVQERDVIVNNYSDKLYKAKQDALDKIVLEGVDVETAIAELNKIKV